jgi:nicotinate-nucleotide adenylyltransferase
MIDQKNIGLFFGTFNPPHIGHTLIANYFYITNDFDEIWLIVSPQNPFKKNSNLLDANLRLKMVELAIEGHYQQL